MFFIIVRKMWKTHKKLYLECCCLWIRKKDPRKKWREGYKCIWNWGLDRKVKNKMDRENNEWWSFSKGERMFIGPCIIPIVDEWKTNLMSLAILFHFLSAQHVSDINISVFRSLRLCWWITKSVVLFCKEGWFSISVTLRCVVVCLVWCVLSLVVVGRCILIDFDSYLLCFVTIVFFCVCYFSHNKVH